MVAPPGFEPGSMAPKATRIPSYPTGPNYFTGGVDLRPIWLVQNEALS